MKFQILSDLHLDFPLNAKIFAEYYLLTNENIAADKLIIAGDTCSYNAKQRTLISQLASKYKFLIEVPGNHDNYNLSHDWPFASYSDKGINYSQYYLNNCYVHFDNIRIICSTLWSNIQFEIPYIVKGISDYHYIQGYNVMLNNRRFNDSIYFIEQALKTTPDDMKCIVVTHHLPLLELISARYAHDKLNEAFASNLYNLVEEYTDKIPYWIHGHSHDFKELKVLNTTFVRNPMGYLEYEEGKKFNNKFIIEV